MAHSGAGTKFVPVNLNRSYGHSSGNGNSSQHSTSQYGGTRARTGGGGGSMVVLSRPRSSQKNSAPKLSVPPPLNLPSLRKEHQRHDLSGSNSGAAGGGSSGMRPGSSGVGWTKAAVLTAGTTQEVKPSIATDPDIGNGTIARSSSYIPPSARLTNSSNSSALYSSSGSRVDNVSVLKGEDFPSLKAALPAAGSVVEKKQRDGLGSKQRPVLVEATPPGSRNGSSGGAFTDIPPLLGLKSNDIICRNDSDDKKSGDSTGGLVRVESDRKVEDFLPGLPSVRINTRSHWEDDERETGNRFVEKSRSHTFMNEAYRERDLDFLRPGNFPVKRVHNMDERRRHGDDPIESSKDGHSTCMRTSSRDGISKPFVSHSKEGFFETGSERNLSNLSNLRPSSRNGEVSKDASGFVSSFRNQSWDDPGRKDIGYSQAGRQPWVKKIDSIGSRGFDRFSRENSKYDQQRHRGDLQNNVMSKSSFSLAGSKVPPCYDLSHNISRDKYASSKTENDLFSTSFIGLVKKKKDILTDTDFHDPVRESFEAELERVQKMQELERQRSMEELGRAMEIPRREEEERVRLAKEHEEHLRRLEEQAQEAAWRAEQERVEAVQKAEEQRMAREEEKRKYILEEERRKQAAKQKLLELEEKIAKRQAEAATSANLSDSNDEKLSDVVSERDNRKVIERIHEKSSPSEPSEHEASPVLDRGNGPLSYHQYQDKELRGSRWDAALGAKLHGRKELEGESRLVQSSGYHREDNSDMDMDGLDQSNNQKWNNPMESEHHHRSIAMEFQDDQPEKFDDNEYHEKDFSSVKSQQSTQQFRVHPPFSSISGIPVRNPDSSVAKMKETRQNDFIDRESALGSNIVEARLLETTAGRQNFGIDSARCDSQSSFSISSPPDTPAQTSYDDLDESCAFPLGSADTDMYVEGNDALTLHMRREKEVGLNSSNVTVAEEEEWAIGNGLQDQDEYDEDESYEDGETHDHDDENAKLAHKFEGINLDVNASNSVDNLVLCFNEGVEVRMPNDELESSLNIDVGDTSLVKSKERVSFDALESNQESPRSVASANAKSDVLQAMMTSERAVNDYSTEMKNVSQLSYASELTNQVTSLATQTNQSSTDTVPSPPEVPLNLQFGLFSGPPLIPSPVPAIQIGSIQMPLHTHHPLMGTSSLSVHSQPPLFHFGPLKYTSHTSHGILPLSSQAGPFVQSPTLGQESSSNNVGEGDLESKKIPHVPSDPVLNCENPETMISTEPSYSKNLKPIPVSDADQHIPGGSLLSVSGSMRSNFGVSKIHPPSFSGRGRKFKSYSRSLLPTPDHPSFHDPYSYKIRPRRQRAEFRVRDASDKSQSFPSSYDVSDKSNGFDRRTAPKVSDRQLPNRHYRPNSVAKVSKQDGLDKRGKDDVEKEHSRVISGNSHTGEKIDASMQDGIVRVFEQPGIQAPSDDDDFIEVRSKRQMLNERRAKREKEINARPRGTKISRKLPSSSRQSSSIDSNNAGLPKNSASDFPAHGIRNSILLETSSVKAPVVSHPLPPIGTPALKSNANTNTETRTSQARIPGGGAKNPPSESLYSSGDKLLDNIQTSLGSWENAHIKNEVITLTQTQLDEAMQPKVSEPSISGSTLTKDKRFPSTASPVSSLLAGERIQFGAVTSPTILPPVASSRKPASNECSLRLQDCDADADAEAAASAVAVAAITNDENNTVSNPLSSVDDTVLATSKRYAMVSEATHDEPFNVALPADLSVDTLPATWPPLPTSQNPSSSVLPHLPAGLPGHFPFYEMNPLLGGRIFAVGQHDETVASQSQKNNGATISGSIGPWPHHSNIDSLYGPPGSFPGSFIAPPGTVPAIHGPPHMVVYNPFAPVGQFGQVGLSFMGTAYVPSSKQPDWKHIPSTSPAIPPEAEPHPMNPVSAQHHPLNLPPRSTLHPFVSPVAMFDVASLQAPPEVTPQPRWCHLPSATPLQNMQQQDDNSLSLLSSIKSVEVGPKLEASCETISRLPALSATSTPSVVTISEAVPRADQISNTSVKTKNSVKIQSNQQYGHSSAPQQHQRYGFWRNNNGEWSQRGPGFQVRNTSSSGADTSFNQLKTKQVYIAKQSSSRREP